MDNLRSAKTFGGIGALLSLIGIIIPSFGFFIGIIGFILIIIAIKNISNETKDKSIFNNFLYSLIILIIAIIIAVVILIITFFEAGGMSYINELQNMVYSDPMDILNVIQPFIIGFIAAVVIFWILLIVSAIYLRKCYNKIGELTNVKWFNTTGLIFLIGAATLIIGIGFLILLIAIIFEIIAFFSLPDELPKESEKKTSERRCPECDRIIPEDALTCPYCGKKYT